MFIVEETGTDAMGNIIMTRKNGDGAYVYGLNMETTIQPIDWLELQGGFTWQRSRYTEPVSWSSESYVEPVKKMLRSPDTYGFFRQPLPKKSYAFPCRVCIQCWLPTLPIAEGVDKDVTVETRSFVDMTVKLSYFFNPECY